MERRNEEGEARSVKKSLIPLYVTILLHNAQRTHNPTTNSSKSSKPSARSYEELTTRETARQISLAFPARKFLSTFRGLVVSVGIQSRGGVSTFVVVIHSVLEIAHLKLPREVQLLALTDKLQPAAFVIEPQIRIRKS
jgi:hypothetical protein